MKKESTNEICIKKILKERIKENQKLFNKYEIKVINNNFKIAKKIYLLGVVNGRDIYK